MTRVDERAVRLDADAACDDSGDNDNDNDNDDDDDNDRDAAEIDAWSTYLREIGQVRRLTPAEELELGRRIAEGDQEALERMIAANLRLVIAVAQRYRHEGLPLHDLVQEGNIGLLRAAQKFDYRRGFRFSTYATWWIRQAVSRAVATQAYAIRVPVHVQEGMGHAERALAGAMEADTDNEGDGVSHVGALPGSRAARDPISLETIELARRARQTISLDRAAGEDDDGALGEVIADADAPSPFEVTSNHLLRERLVGLLQGLPERERAIINLRYGLVDGQPRTCAEVGARVHLTRERVRQLEAAALRQLRQAQSEVELDGFLS